MSPAIRNPGRRPEFNPNVIILANTIDDARLQANAVPGADRQDNVYGDLSEALTKTLVQLTGSTKTAASAYELIVGSGFSVIDAVRNAVAAEEDQDP